MRKSLLLCTLLFLLAGCATTLNLREVDSPFLSGQYRQALEAYEKDRDRVVSRQGEIVYALDAGMLNHWAGEFKSSSSWFLQSVRDMEEMRKSITGSLARHVVNDNTLAYPGEKFEYRFALIFDALNYARCNNPEEAMTSIRRISEFSDPGPLTSYLGMLFSHFTGNRSDEDYFARIGKHSLKPCAEGEGRISLFAFSGREPEKMEMRDVYYLGDGQFVTIAVPDLVVRPSRVDRVEVEVSGRLLEAELLEDLGSSAVLCYLEDEASVYARAFVRATAKGMASQIYSDVATAMWEDDDISAGISIFASLFSLFAEGYHHLSERADVRMSHYFPSRVDNLDLVLSEGVYDIRVNYLDRAGRVIDSSLFEGVECNPRGVVLESYSPK